MINLIIICGMPCSGKTSISKELCSKIGYDVVSKDFFKEELFEKYGFKSYEEKKALDLLAEEKFYIEIEKRIEKKENIIIDKWLQGIEPLKKVKNIYNANIIFIRLITNPLVATYRYNQRRKNSNRPISFIIKNQYPVTDESSVIYEEQMTVECMKEKALRTFYKDGITNFIEIDTSNIETQFKKIMNDIIYFVKLKVK